MVNTLSTFKTIIIRMLNLGPVVTSFPALETLGGLGTATLYFITLPLQYTLSKEVPDPLKLTMYVFSNIITSWRQIEVWHISNQTQLCKDAKARIQVSMIMAETTTLNLVVPVRIFATPSINKPLLLF